MQQHAIHLAPFLPCSTPWLGEHSFKRHRLPCIRSTDRHSAYVGEEPPCSRSLPCLSLHFHGRGPWPSGPATPLRGGAPLGSLQACVGAVETSRCDGPTASPGRTSPATPLAWCWYAATSHGLVPYCAARRSAPTLASRSHRRQPAIIGVASASAGDSPAVAVEPYPHACTLPSWILWSHATKPVSLGTAPHMKRKQGHVAAPGWLVHDCGHTGSHLHDPLWLSPMWPSAWRVFEQ
jgi:hypothetical protein